MLEVANFLKNNSSKVGISFFLIYYLIHLALCEYVKDLLLEESNVQPIAAPVAVCGGIRIISIFAIQVSFEVFVCLHSVLGDC